MLALLIKCRFLFPHNNQYKLNRSIPIRILLHSFCQLNGPLTRSLQSSSIIFLNSCKCPHS